MSDAEIVRLCAEKVMGLTGPWCDCTWAPLDIGDGFCHDCEEKVLPNPLTSDADSCAVLDKLAEGGMVSICWFPDGGVWGITTYPKGRETQYCQTDEPDRKRAIVMAALRTVGAME